RVDAELRGERSVDVRRRVAIVADGAAARRLQLESASAFWYKAPSWWPSRDRGRARGPRGSRPPPRGLASRGSSTQGDDEGGGDGGPAHVELGSGAHAGGRLGDRRPASVAREAGGGPGAAGLC